jgi:hypothetical protein
LTHPALTIKSSASETYSSGVLDSFGIGEGKCFLRHLTAPLLSPQVADAHRGDGKRFVVRADKKLTAFRELESAARGLRRAFL